MISDPINLVLVYVPSAVDVEDFRKVSQRVKAVAENINVYVREDKAPNSALLEDLARHRTLVFSPMQMRAFHVNRGRVYAGRPMQKSEQLMRLQLAGLPVPAWTSMDRGKRLDPDFWGEFVVVKPEINSGGRGVRITKTSQLNQQSHELEQFSRNGNNFVVQMMVRSTTFSKIRVETLFDEVLHARQFRFKDKIKFDTVEDLKEYERQFVTTTNHAEYCDRENVFELAKRCFDAFDDAPLLGLDIMLDENENPVFIEANPGGNTWHYSSAHTGRQLRAEGVFLEEQFGAFERAGDVLAKRALAEAI